MTHKPLLIEHWLPIQAIGAESLRDASAAQKPPLNRLHVWWARRPLTTSRAAILASVLPQWSNDFPKPLREKFPNEEVYRSWFLRFLGILGDPVAGKKLLAWARQQGKTIPNPYSYPRAYTTNPSIEDLQVLGNLLEWTWGKRNLSMLDPFAGGGAIPFEALRYGFKTYANDLNPVAAVILKATLDYPARFGPSLADDIRKWGKRWYELVKPKLQPYFTPLPAGAEGAAYLWARTVACPTTGKPVPLSPNWWLSTGEKPAAVRIICEPEMDTPRFEIVTGAKAQAANPDVGTISRGIARSPWTGETIDGDYIKAEAQAGRMGQILYAVAIKRRGGFDFRVPTEQDLQATNRAESDLVQMKSDWMTKDIIPTESIPIGNKTSEPLRYGITTWDSLYSSRQLLSMATLIEVLRDLQSEIQVSMDVERAEAVYCYLTLAFGKGADYNCKLATWEVTRQMVKHVFQRHDFAMKWTYGEFDAAGNLVPWIVNQVSDAYKGLASLTLPTQTSFIESKKAIPTTIAQSSAASLPHIPNSSIDNITVDPPYYDNVQYAELSDFFYVWLKRSVGHLYPEFFRDELTNKDDEAVANPARFAGMGKKKKELAEQDYENKMTAAFREMYRVLRPEGSLTVMFTHKKVEAWDTLASALIHAGFVIKASWPVHTESEHSLHQAKKNAAASTILLACRKRAPNSPSPSGRGDRGEVGAVWWDDIQQLVRETARQKAQEFAEQGISGADLYISVFGPTLAIISERWPVLTSEIDPKTNQPKALRPETALDLAREEVIRLRKDRLLTGNLPSSYQGKGLGMGVRFDPVTDWYLMAWDAFAAEQFPYDEGRKLAIALGVDMDRLIMTLKRLAVKKSDSLVLQTPVQRRKKGMVDDDLQTFEHWIDAAHTAMMLYEEDGAGACDAFLQRTRLKTDATFQSLLQSMINAIPRARIKGKFVRPEAETLENMRLAFFPDLSAPAEEEPQLPVEKQLGMFEEESAEEDEEAGEEE